MARRYDFAVYSDDRYVTNALLTLKDVHEMEADGFRCVRVRDTVDETHPRFRGKRSVSPKRSRWDR